MGIRFEISSRFQIGIQFEISSRFQIVNGPEISSRFQMGFQVSLRIGIRPENSSQFEDWNSS